MAQRGDRSGHWPIRLSDAGALAFSLCFLSSSLIAAPPKATPRAHESAGALLSAPTVAAWVDVRLADRLAGLESAGLGVGFRDRRVDPSARLSLSASGTLGELLGQALAPHGCGAAELDGVVYVGPERSSRRLGGLAERNRRQLAQLSPTARGAMRRVDALAWPRLTEPRAMIISLAEGHGLSIVNPDALPHDVWDAGKLPGMTLSDRLTLLLIGFEKTWRVQDTTGVLEIVPIPADLPSRKSPRLARRRDQPPAAASGGLGQQRITLTVKGQPARAVLERLSGAFGWEVAFTEGQQPAASERLDKRIDLSVQQASVQNVLDAIGQQTGLILRAAPGKITVSTVEEE